MGYVKPPGPPSPGARLLINGKLSEQEQMSSRVKMSPLLHLQWEEQKEKPPAVLGLWPNCTYKQCSLAAFCMRKGELWLLDERKKWFGSLIKCHLLLSEKTCIYSHVYIRPTVGGSGTKTKHTTFLLPQVVLPVCDISVVDSKKLLFNLWAFYHRVDSRWPLMQISETVFRMSLKASVGNDRHPATLRVSKFEFTFASVFNLNKSFPEQTIDSNPTPLNSRPIFHISHRFQDRHYVMSILPH